MLIYGVSPILYKKIPNMSPIALIFIFSLVGSLFSGIILFTTESLVQFNSQNVLSAVVVGLLINVAFLAYITAIQTGPVSYSTIIRNLSVAITFILAVVFLSEKVTLLKAAGGVLGILAIILLSL